MKKSQLKSMGILVLISILIISLVLAVGSNLLSPSDSSTDNDGQMDFRGTCVPTPNSTTENWNITNATLYTNVDGTWKGNGTKQVSIGSNVTYYANFTLNQSAEGTFQWNIECIETNSTVDDGEASHSNSAFAGNRTIVVDYSRPTVVTTSPDAGAYDLDGTNISVVCTTSPTSGWNITSVDLLTNIGGGWTVNQTHTVTDPDLSSTVVGNFTINQNTNTSLAEGDYLFGCRASQTQHDHYKSADGGVNPSKTGASANQTFVVQYPPSVTLLLPPDQNWSQNRRVNLSYNVNTSFDSETQIRTRIWTNESGEWLPGTGTIFATNGTTHSHEYIFLESTNIIWGVEAIQQNDGNVFNFSVNRTIRIDSTDPVVSISSPADSSTNNGTLVVSWTASDINLDSTSIFVGGGIDTDTYENANFTNMSVNPSVTSYTHVLNTSFADGVYNFSVEANDSSGRIIRTENITFIVDTTSPNSSNVGNFSVVGPCSQRKINWSTNESTNHTFSIDTDTEVADGTIFENSSFSTEHSILFDFGLNAEVLHYFNLTVCDVAGNCNTSGQKTFDTPARVCGGWNQYGIYYATTLGEIMDNSGADLVYVWNQTSQNWIFVTSGLSTNTGTDVGTGTGIVVAHLFENTNSTWVRNSSVTDGTVSQYNINISSVNNFIAIPRTYNFGNLSESFTNGSAKDGGAGVEFPSTDETGTFIWNISAFAGWNQSKQGYVNHIYNFTWANSTVIEPCHKRTENPTCMEVVWVASSFNVSWNNTAVYANWTA